MNKRNDYIRRITGLIMLTMLIAVVCPGEYNTLMAAEKLSNPTYDANKDYAEWDCIYFGNYPQDSENADNVQPIKWRVLSVSGNDAMLISDKCIFADDYIHSYIGINNSAVWSGSKLKSMLNGVFADKAFTDTEKGCIIKTTVKNNKNPEYSENIDNSDIGYSDTEETIYVLSYDEACNPAFGFCADGTKESKTRQAGLTVYANSLGKVRKAWWLRTIGSEIYKATYVDINGQISLGGTYFFNDQPDKPKDYNGVRPVLHLDISNTDVWTYAGKVTSEDVIEELPSPASKATEASAPENAKITPSPTQTPTSKNDINTSQPLLTSNHQVGVSIIKNTPEQPLTMPNNQASASPLPETAGISEASEDRLIKKDNLVYKIIKSDTGKQVIISDISKTGAGKNKYNIPKSIKYKGAAYRITGIDQNIFKKLKSSKITINITKGDKLKLINNKGYSFGSSNKKIATISGKGIIKTKKVGNCNVKVYDKKKRIATISLKVSQSA